MADQLNICNYWYESEYFSPCMPEYNKHKDIVLTRDTELPWPCVKSEKNQRRTFDIYLGRCTAEKLIPWLIQKSNLTAEEKIEPNNSKSCVCAFKVDSEGQFIKGSFALSSFVWAICKLARDGVDAGLNHEEFESTQRKWEKLFYNPENGDMLPIIVNKSMIFYILNQMRKNLGLNRDLADGYVLIKQKTQYGRKKGDEYEFPPVSSATELISSFYLDDIEKVRDNPTEKTKQYVKSLLNGDLSVRFEINKDVSQMMHWVDASKFPLGMWPSLYSPSLMQQLGINIAISGEQDIFSVNGPPGTGKTTLLKEIIASNIVRRAVEMSKFDNPNAAFDMRKFSALNQDIYNKSYYIPKQELTGYGVLVASNNNPAVENISMELPRFISKDRTGRFSCNDNDNYFADIASDLIGGNAWGLISAKLGKAENIAEFKKKVIGCNEQGLLKILGEYFPKNPAEKSQKQNEAAEQFRRAKGEFQKALTVVMKDVSFISDVQTKIRQLYEQRAEYAAKLNQLQSMESSIRERTELVAREEELLSENEKQKALLEQSIAMLKKQAPFRTRLSFLFKSNPIVHKIIEHGKELDAVCIQNVSLRYKIENTKADKEKQEREFIRFRTSVLAQKKQVEELIDELQAPMQKFGESFGDEGYWKDIAKNISSQTVSPWTYLEYDKHREELFYRALMLHKAFILNCNPIKQNLMRLKAIWDGKIQREEAMGSLINTLMMVVPVISTTFASVHTLLSGVNKNELGMLIIDEAGQATPQSALGALWRCKKAIIVGDPLQVEPITTIPPELKNVIANKYNIPIEYRSDNLSVQNLADRINPYGGYRMIGDEQMWIGCPLRVHRRCIDPMFSVSNEVAYAGEMFLKTTEADANREFTYPESFWLDVKGFMIGRGNQNVKEQNDCAIYIFKQAIKHYNGKPDIFVITPFRKIANELRNEVQKIVQSELGFSVDESYEWAKDHCGTVHTFQGKEAAETIIVLGCDMQQGRGSALWVGKKPNLINVAVSRAKYRLYVIGDYQQWKDIQYVNVCCDRKDLKVISRRELITH